VPHINGTPQGKKYNPNINKVLNNEAGIYMKKSGISPPQKRENPKTIRCTDPQQPLHSTQEAVATRSVEQQPQNLQNRTEAETLGITKTNAGFHNQIKDFPQVATLPPTLPAKTPNGIPTPLKKETYR